MVLETYDTYPDRTYEWIGDQCGVSKQRVHQIVKAAGRLDVTFILETPRQSWWKRLFCR